MNRVLHRGQYIAYQRFEGLQQPASTVLLQHGLLSQRKSWLDVGYVEALKANFNVITVDSLGHGDSDKPRDPKLYERSRRAGHIAAVLDAESIESVHYIGYSMGGWIGTGMALYHPDRLASLTLGGWDPVGGLSAVPASGTFNDLLERAQDSVPTLTTWVTKNVLPGLEACWKALQETQGSEAALSGLNVPVLLWPGLADGCLDPLQRLQARYPEYRLLTVPGDHVAARMVHTRESIEGLLNFLELADN